MAEEWLTVKEIAEILNISRRQVTNRIKQGRLKAKRNGRLWLVHSSLSPEIEEIAEIPKRSQKADSGRFEELEEMVDYLKQQVENKDHQIEEKDKQIETLQRHLLEKDKAAIDKDRVIEESRQ